MNRTLETALALILAAGGAAQAAPVVITAYTVTDGKLGALKFTAAPVTMTFYGDTEDVTMTTTGSAVSYRIDKGYATVAVNVQGTTTVAEIDQGQIYVHYDVQAGIAGFGSYATGPYYPLTLGCYTVFALCNYQTPSHSYEFLDGFNQTISAIADVESNPGDSSYYSAQVEQLPESLTKSTLLTGYVNACAGPYNFSSAQICSSPPATMISTSQGEFYLQDQNQPKGFMTVEAERMHDD